MVNLLTMSEYQVLLHIEKLANTLGFSVQREFPNGLLININEGLPLVCAHSDTINGFYRLHHRDIVQHRNMISLSSKSSANCLGGDDRCGIWIIEQLLKDNCREYSYAIFTGEENGCKGSSNLVKRYDFSIFSCFIGLDRRNQHDMAVYGYENGELLSKFKERGFKKVYGSITDIAVLSQATGIASVNLSCGFFMEHSKKEVIDIEIMENTYSILSSLAGSFSSSYPAEKLTDEVILEDDLWLYCEECNEYLLEEDLVFGKCPFCNSSDSLIVSDLEEMVICPYCKTNYNMDEFNCPRCGELNHVIFGGDVC